MGRRKLLLITNSGIARTATVRGGLLVVVMLGLAAAVPALRRYRL